MNSIKKTILILTAIAIVQGGCNINVPEEIVPNAFTKQQKAVAPDPVVSNNSNRYISNASNDNSFDDARGWAIKYKELKEQNDQLKKRNGELTTDNTRLMERFDVMRVNIKTAETELSDANELLIEMRKELDSWKTNVLGFREESNYVHKEQLKALVKILKLLGAEYNDSEVE